jgi:hypothetical protein
MKRSITRKTPALQIVVQGHACALQAAMDQHHIAYEVLDQPGPLIMRIYTTDWQAVRALAAERGYVRPDFFSQSDLIAEDPFMLQWQRQRTVVTR